jgi:hypothetical protein
MDTPPGPTDPTGIDMDISSPPASPIEVPSSPDELSTAFDTQPRRLGRSVQPLPSVARKRPTDAANLSPPQRLPPLSGPFTFTSRTSFPTTALPQVASCDEAVSIARDMLIQASTLADTKHRQSMLLDLLEVFRDFTENGRVNKHGVSLLASQVSNLETVSRSLGTKVKQLQKPTPETISSKTTPSTSMTSTLTPPAAKARTPGPMSYAATASNGEPKTSDWQLIAKKKTPPPSPKNSLSTRQLVLVQDQPATFNSLELRNAFNRSFADKGVTGPVVASVTPSAKRNIVVTTTPTYNAKYLLEHQSIWKSLTSFKEALPIQPWFKVVVHNIPTSFVTNESLEILKSEITAFNKGFKIVGNPYWLTSKDRRTVQQSGSVCIAFATEQEAQRAIKSRLYLLGISVRVEKLHSTPASSQCQKCQRFGHTEARCAISTACKFCAEPHPTSLHKCNSCGAKGRTCVHTVPLCVNCKGAHTADSKECDTFKATLHPHRSVETPDDTPWSQFGQNAPSTRVW